MKEVLVMGKFNKSLAVLMLVAFFISGCSPKENAQIDTNKMQEQSEKDKGQKIIEDFKNKYSAIELDPFTIDYSKFSAEIADDFKGKNIYSLFYISDVFYLDNNLYMYTEHWSDYKILLQITPEQYSIIKSMHDKNDNPVHTVFTLDNIEPMLPTIEGEFTFYISESDDVSSDEYASISLDSRIIHGTLVDIIDVQ